MAKAKRPPTKTKIFFGLVFSLVLLTLVISSIILFRLTGVGPEEFLRQEELQPSPTRITPSKVLTNRSKYNKERFSIRGKVVFEAVVCERKECPAEDPCCGCSQERNIYLVDSETIITSKTKGRLKLVNSSRKTFCQRQLGSCDYDCQGWGEGAIYDVLGQFFYEAPPPGWSMSLDYYFQVEDKQVVRTIGLEETVDNFIKEIKDTLKKLKTSGYYVLP